MGRRRRRNIYLGRRVRDVRRPGLDSLSEVRGIANAIVKDYRAGRISRRTATARLNLLKLIVKKDKSMRGKVRKAWAIIERARAKMDKK